MPTKITAAVEALKATIRKSPLTWLAASLIVIAAGTAALYFLVPQFLAYAQKCFYGGCE